MGLVCFRLKGSDKLNEKLLSNINASGKIHMVPASVNEQYVIRFCVNAENSTDDDIGELCLKYLIVIHSYSEFIMYFQNQSHNDKSIFGNFRRKA